MKPKIKKEILYVILIVMLSSVTTLAVNYTASEIGYTPTDSTWTVSNVQQATDSLYVNVVRKNPIGEILAFMGTIVPEYFLACDGTVYNISEYPHLAEHIKNNFGTYNYFGGNGTTTFAVPDLRGEFLRGTGTNGHTNQGNGENVGVHQDGTIHSAAYGDGGWGYVPKLGITSLADKELTHGKLSGALKTDSTQSSFLNTYTSRPTNTSVMYAIRYE